jgi:putative sporulation protein YtaF
MAYGLKSIRIPPLSNLIIALCSGAIAVVSCLFGQSVLPFKGNLPSGFLGGVLLAALGVWTLVGHFREIYFSKRDLEVILKSPEKVDIDRSGHISARESLALGAALAANATVAGIGAGILGFNIVAMFIAVSAFSYISVAIGLFCGRKLSGKRKSACAGVFSGLILLGLGLFSIFIA